MFRELKPMTPSLRHSFTLIKHLRKKPLLKNKIKHHNRSLGRGGNFKKIVCRHREGGAKKKYRSLDLSRTKKMSGVVCSVEHDPYRSSFIMSVFDHKKNLFFYSLAQESIEVGDSVLTRGKKVKPLNGNSTYIRDLPPGTLLSNVPLVKNGGGMVARAAGTCCLLRGESKGFCFVDLPSGEIRLVPSKTYVSVGRVSNDYHFLEQSGKAGRSRWKGVRPTNRGVSMNPVDHPNGGGEGKKSGFGRTPWGKPGKQKSSVYKPLSTLVVRTRNESI